METKYIKIPFDAEKAKKIQRGEIEGRIVTRNGRKARVICWDAKRDDSIVALVEDDKGLEGIKSYISTGNFYIHGDMDIDLMLEVPEYMTFKDGDVLYVFCKNMFSYIFIKREGDRITDKYTYLNNFGFLCTEDFSCCCQDGNILEIRLATEQEKQKLIDALKASNDPRAKKYLERFFPEHSNSSNIGKDCELKPFDKVLVRDNDDCYWSADFFSYKDDDENMPYRCIGSWYRYCIPYQGNEHLLGTTESPQ